MKSLYTFHRIKKLKKLKFFYNFAIFNYFINKFNVYPIPSTSQSERIFFVFSIRAWRVRTSKYRFWKKRPWKITILRIKINSAKIKIRIRETKFRKKILDSRDYGLWDLKKLFCLAELKNGDNLRKTFSASSERGSVTSLCRWRSLSGLGKAKLL